MVLTFHVACPMERCVAHVDLAGVSTRVPHAQTPEEHLFSQQSVQSVKEGATWMHPTKQHDVACDDGTQEELDFVMDERR